jgi:transmembrane sensor
MNPASRPAEQILKEAGEWLLDLQSADVSVERIAAWQQWMGSSERHVRAFDQLQRTWALADGLASPAAKAPDPAWAPAEGARRPELLSGMRRYALAASVAAVALVAALWGAMDRPVVLQTPIGSKEVVELADGSRVSVGAASRLRVEIDEARRRVDLDRGEAFFDVARDASRPFTVHAGRASITAVGTAFNVSKAGEQVIVGVSSGSVAVKWERPSAAGAPDAGARALLGAGQRLILNASTGSSEEVEPIALPAVAGWREGRLRYAGDTLERVIADANRYLRDPIVIEDPSIATLRVTGTVAEENLEAWVASLQTALPVELVKDVEGRQVLRRRAGHR